MAKVFSPRKGCEHRNVMWDIKKSYVEVRSRKMSVEERGSKCCKSGVQVRRLSLPVPTGYETGSDDDVSVITRGAVVTDGTQVYFSPSSFRYRCPTVRNVGQRHAPHYVFSYNTSGDEWSTLPPCEVHDFGLAVVDGFVTIVGGEYDRIRRSFSKSTTSEEYTSYTGPFISDSLLVLNGEKWEKEHFPPMTTGRKDPSVICAQQYLIVAGGILIVKHHDQGHTFRRETAVDSVEVMDTETKTWSQVASLPEATSSLVAAHCGDQLYFLGGKNDTGSINSVFTCFINSLVKSVAIPCDLGKNSEESLIKSVDSEGKLKQRVGENSVWQKVANIPVFRSTCVVINGELFAIGGRTSTYRSSADIYCYNPFDDSWQVAGQMPTARSMCIAASVMTKLVVIGGLKEYDEPTDAMEIGTFISDPTLTEKNLWSQLRFLDDWYNLGVQLDIPKDKLREIEDSHPDKPTRCKEETMDYWLKRGENLSWETLATAVADMGHLDIAIQIREKYLQKPADANNENSQIPKSKMEDCTEVLAEHLQEKLKTSDSVYLDTTPRIAQLMRMKTAKGERVEVIKSVTPQWRQLGLLMDFDKEGQTVDLIEAEHQLKGQAACCQEMFKLWLKRPDATWDNLIELLIDCEQKVLAEQVKKCIIGL